MSRPLVTVVAPGVVEVYDDGCGPAFEVVAGEKREMHSSLLAAIVTTHVAVRIDRHADRRAGGGYTIPHPFVVVDAEPPFTILRPHVGYWRREQYPEGIPPRGEAGVAPAWAVYVVAPGDEVDVLYGRVDEFFRAGTELFWTVDPVRQIVRTERPDGAAHAYRAADTITAEPVLPGFSTKVADFFPV